MKREDHPHFRFPALRRDNATGTVVIRNDRDAEYPWIVIHPGHVGWARRSEAEVATWPFLNQFTLPPDEIQRKLDDGTKRAKALQRENGRLSAIVGALRAQLARERERRREKQQSTVHP